VAPEPSLNASYRFHAVLRLTLDLRFVRTSSDVGPDERRLDLRDFATAVKENGVGSLIDLLWRNRYERVRVLSDGHRLSGPEAGVLVLAALSRARRFDLEVEGQVLTVRRPVFLARAFRSLAVAVPRELSGSYRTYRRARVIAARDYDLPLTTAKEPSSVLYVRPTSTLHEMGEYVGGAATHTIGVINGLAENGVSVHVFAPERPPGLAESEITELPIQRVYHLAHWLTFADYSDELAKAASSESADFVYQRYDLGAFAGLELAARLGVPFVLEFNGSEIWTAREWGQGTPRFVETLEALERRELSEASLVVVVSDVLREQLVAAGVDSSRVLVNPNGVDVERLAHYRRRPPRAWRSSLSQPEAPTVGFVGSFGLWHGVLLLPRLIETVARERPDARWILIGGGLLYEEVASEIKARGLSAQVVMTGVVPHDLALSFLAACDVCVSPHVPNPDGSRFFGSPTKLFEYMGLAKPIVASALEQIGEVIEDGRTGLLCPPGDVEAAAAAVVRLLGNETLRQSLGAAALEEASLTYSWKSHTRRILDALSPS
jgi:glycosyltransferase involved in cell wall biosynthesis